MCNMNRTKEWEDNEYMKDNNWSLTWKGQDWKTKIGTHIEMFHKMAFIGKKLNGTIFLHLEYRGC